jgi:hypothetical protein
MYTVTLRSFTANTNNGFQDNLLGSPLDGKDTGTPGQNYVFTFSVSAPPVAVGIPDFARGPSNTDSLFLPSTIGNGGTFNLIYTNPNTVPTTGTATVTFSTVAATLQQNIQAAMDGMVQIGVGAGNVKNAVPVILNPNTLANGANVQITFQNSYFATATNQLFSSTTPGVSVSVTTINVASNVVTDGIPVVLSNAQNVTGGTFTLQYDPTLLHISGAVSKIAGASFSASITEIGHTGTAVLSLSSPTRISSTTNFLAIGSLLATVPFGVTATYGAKQLLHFTNLQLFNTGGTSIPITNQDAVEVAAFYGDVNDTGLPFNSSNALGTVSAVANLNVNGVQQTIPGFTLFPNLDPVIIGEVNLSPTTNITSSDTNKMNQQLTSPQPTIPWLPAGLSVVAAGPDPTLTISRMSNVGSRMSNPAFATSDIRLSTFDVFAVNIDTAHPEGSTGMIQGTLALTYDPTVFDVSTADVHLGTVLENGSGWEVKAEVNSQLGLIGIEFDSNAPIQSSAGGSLVTIAMHVRDAVSAGTAVLTIVPCVDPAGGPRLYQTSLQSAEGELMLNPAETGTGAAPGAPGIVTIAPQALVVSSLVTAGQSEGAKNALNSFDSQFPAVPGKLLATSSLPLAVLEETTLSVEGNTESGNAIRDLAFVQEAAGLDQTAEWLPQDGLADRGQTARRSPSSIDAGLFDELASIFEDDLAGLEVPLARARNGEGREAV